MCVMRAQTTPSRAATSTCHACAQTWFASRGVSNMASNSADKSWLLVVIAFFAIACGNGDGFNSGLSGKKALKDLSSKDLKKFCDEADDYISAALPPGLIAKAQCAQQAL